MYDLDTICNRCNEEIPGVADAYYNFIALPVHMPSLAEKGRAYAFVTHSHCTYDSFGELPWDVQTWFKEVLSDEDKESYLQDVLGDGHSLTEPWFKQSDPTVVGESGSLLDLKIVDSKKKVVSHPAPEGTHTGRDRIVGAYHPNGIPPKEGVSYAFVLSFNTQDIVNFDEFEKTWHDLLLKHFYRGSSGGTLFSNN